MGVGGIVARVLPPPHRLTVYLPSYLLISADNKGLLNAGSTDDNIVSNSHTAKLLGRKSDRVSKQADTEANQPATLRADHLLTCPGAH